ncbi:histidine kinase [Fulvivirga sp. 29W222]|uniref:Histidine kinase n=1 Tax=Fulvivirga marina TaxID=2494733 RepID=A0A937FZW5_9BACT|nr:histidine kinase [Fulvivirga marina]MBL6447533.1 histidine kinase [Fulvivirga marina]
MVTQRTQLVALSILLWIGYFLIHYYFLSFPFDSEASIILATRVVAIHAILFYVNYHILLPKLLDKNKYVTYFLSLAILIVFTYFLFSLSNEMPFIHDAQETGRHRRFHEAPRLERAFRSRIFINNIISSLAVLFISSTYWTIRRNQQRKQREINLMNENLQTEMKFLKSQINPHFLLNAMNNIYYMATTRGEKTPDMIMKLSEMMKYVLYETNAKQVLLSREISYINDYIDFQRIKFEQQPDIRVDFSGADGDKNISPMILIPFIENAFKHSNLGDDTSFVEIRLSTSGHSLQMLVSNTISRSSTKDKTGGIGLENVKRRLEFLYPDQYELSINDDEHVFTINLKLELK